jgi:hypothetical protein
MPCATTRQNPNHSAIFPASLAVGLALVLILAAQPLRAEEPGASRDGQAEPGTFMNFVDKYHSYLVGQVNQPAVWFDNFFGDRRTDDLELPTSFVRLRIATRYTEGEGFKFPIRLRANIKLPRASRKLRLVIVGESFDELQATRAKDPAADITGEGYDTENSSVGLRYMLYRTLRSTLNFGGGTSSLSPFEYYGRISYLRLIHIGSENIIRIRQTGFWNSIHGLGETSSLDLEEKFAHAITGRLSLSGTYYDADPGTENNNGLNWALEHSLFRALTPKTAASFDLGAYGVTRPGTKATNYRIGSRLRTNAIRPWLFFEIEPEVTFPEPETGPSKAVGAIMVMMEIQFASADD